MSTISKKRRIEVGKKVVIESTSHTNANHSVVFEDDGDTGYFYAVDKSSKSFIVDALGIYNVQGVKDKDRPSEVAIAWSTDGSTALLLINNYPHAFVNFSSKEGFCRTGFPPPLSQSDWSTKGHAWREEELSKFR